MTRRRWSTSLFRSEALVGEPDVAELDAAGARAGQGIGGCGDFGGCVEQLEDALAGGHGGLQDVVFVAKGPGWGGRSASEYWMKATRMPMVTVPRRTPRPPIQMTSAMATEESISTAG